MFLPPKIRQVLTPPPLPDNVLLPSSTAKLVVKASHAITANNDLNSLQPCLAEASNAKSKTTAPASISGNTTKSSKIAATTAKESKNNFSNVQRLVTLHPSKPLVAYIAEPLSNSSQQRLVVQNTQTRQVVWSRPWTDAVVLVFGEQDTNKFPAALQALGRIISLEFYDSSTIFWSGMQTCSASDGSSTFTRGTQWQVLVVQTTHRIIFFNTMLSGSEISIVPQKVPILPLPSCPIWLHLSEEAMAGAEPSSNILPVSERWMLLGCADGSFKCFDWKSRSVVKSIKGLGKGDWIVRVLAANPYKTEYTADANLARRKRIITVTKRGMAYLIELEISDGDNKANSLDIRPPLARFLGGVVESSAGTGSGSYIEYPLLTYDAHRDWVWWLAPPSKTGPKLLLWDLHKLKSDLVQQSLGSKHIFKPDPTSIFDFFAPVSTNSSSQTSWVVWPDMVHTSFLQETLVSTVISSTGDLYVMGAAADQREVTTTPVLVISIAALLRNEMESDRQHLPVVKVYSVRARLLGNLTEMLVTTSLGIVILDWPTGRVPDARYWHLGASMGSLGKSVLSVNHPATVCYGSLDMLKAQPVGLMSIKSSIPLYESPAPTHLPDEFKKRPFRTAPVFLPSPSGLYLCLMWPSELRYEILHLPSLMYKASSRRGSDDTSGRNPVVFTGHDIADFGWLGDDDVFAVIHAPDLLISSMEWTTPLTKMAEMSPEIKNMPALSNLKDIRNYSKNVASLGVNLTVNATKAATSVTKAATSTAVKTTMAATTAATSSVTKVVKTANKGVKKSFGLFSGKSKKNKHSDNSTLEMTAKGDDDESESHSEQPIASVQAAISASMANSGGSVGSTAQTARNLRRHVELKRLYPIDTSAAELSLSTAAATCNSLGELQIRGGNRSPPTALFGGPVLCVGTRSEGDTEGHAYFYTRKRDEKDDRATVYSTSGPMLPYPDILEWDEDGHLCAFIIHNRVSIFVSEAPEFILLSTVMITSVSDTNSRITSAKFVHGVLYCTTWDSVHCVFLGDVRSGVCKLDTFCLASSHVPYMPAPSDGANFASFHPSPLSSALVQPIVLGYQSGSLLVSTARGIYALPLGHPILRIGTLLCGGQVDRAVSWFDAFPATDHEALADFLERRGHPDLALSLSGLSVERLVDISMRHGHVGRLEEIVEDYGIRGLRAVDMGRGYSVSIYGPGETAASFVVCVGAYLLAHGRVELVRRLATECLRLGEDGKKDAFMLAALMMSNDTTDATRLIRRAVDPEGGLPRNWVMGDYVREHFLTD